MSTVVRRLWAPDKKLSFRAKRGICFSFLLRFCLLRFSLRPLRLLFSSSALNPFLLRLFPYFLTSFHHPRQHCGFLLLQHPVSPPRNPFHRQRPQADALQFFQRVPFLEQHAPQLFFLRIPHPHFVPIIRRASARRVRLAHRLHLHANLFSQPLEVQQRQQAFHLHLLYLLQLRSV